VLFSDHPVLGGAAERCREAPPIGVTATGGA
jgi:hypothetical protein